MNHEISFLWKFVPHNKNGTCILQHAKPLGCVLSFLPHSWHNNHNKSYLMALVKVFQFGDIQSVSQEPGQTCNLMKTDRRRKDFTGRKMCLMGRKPTAVFCCS